MTDSKKIQVLADEERAVFEKKYGYTYHSKHEAYAVLLEECEEAKGEFIDLQVKVNHLWDDIKTDASEKRMRDTLLDTKHAAMLAVQELIQVIGVCDKSLKGYDK